MPLKSPNTIRDIVRLSDKISNTQLSTDVVGATSGNILYASRVGCVLNSNLTTGGGTDDTVSLQGAINKLHQMGGGRMIVDGVALVSNAMISSTQWSAIQLYSNITLEFLEGCGLFLAPNMNITLLGNYQTGTPGTYTDSNIKVIGGTLNCNGANQINLNYYSNAPTNTLRYDKGKCAAILPGAASGFSWVSYPYSTGSVSSTINITNGGSGYTVAPTVTIGSPIGGPGGVRATATSTISGGVVTHITLTNPGTLYNANPSVTIAPPTSGITATATTTYTSPYSTYSWPNYPWVLGVYFGGVSGLYIERVHILNSGTYGLTLANCQKIRFFYITIEWDSSNQLANQDGIHLWDPIDDLISHGLKTIGGTDNQVAINQGENLGMFSNRGVTSGPMTNIMFVDSCLQSTLDVVGFNVYVNNTLDNIRFVNTVGATGPSNGGLHLGSWQNLAITMGSFQINGWHNLGGGGGNGNDFSFTYLDMRDIDGGVAFGLSKSQATYPSGDGFDSQMDIYYPGSTTVLADLAGNLYYADGNIVIDTGGTYNYLNGFALTDPSNFLYYPIFEQPLADTSGNLYYGAGGGYRLTDGSTSIFFPNGELMGDSSSNLYGDVSKTIIAINSFSSSGNILLGFNVFTGSTSSQTLTLPLQTNGGKVIIKNRSSVTVTIAGDSGSDIYTTSAVSSYSLTAGSYITFISDGTYWNQA